MRSSRRDNNAQACESWTTRGAFAGPFEVGEGAMNAAAQCRGPAQNRVHGRKPPGCGEFVAFGDDGVAVVGRFKPVPPGRRVVVDAASGFGFEGELASAIGALDGCRALPREPAPSDVSAKAGARNGFGGVAE